MSQIDRALVEWDEMFRFKPTKGRVGKLTIAKARIPSRAPPPLKSRGAAAARGRLGRMVRKVPEVMVKVSGGGRGMNRIKAHFDYISRNGEVALEDERGQVIAGREAVRDLRQEWKYGLYGIPEESHRKEAFNIVLSMPPGTDRSAVTDAARAFAQIEFGDNHQYVFATHDDERHPHVHLCVKALGTDGTRLNPRKADLQRWRERFAEALRDRGIDANATPRRIRGSLRRTVRQAARYSGVPQGRTETAGKPFRASPKAIEGYAALAMALARGDREDRSLAIGVTKIVSDMTGVAAPVRAQSPNAVAAAKEQGVTRSRKEPSPGRER